MELLIYIYIVLNIISTYNIEGRLLVLLMSQIFTIFFFVSFFKIILKNHKINLYILLIIVSFIFSNIFNLEDSSKYIINIFSLGACYYIVEYTKTINKSITDITLKILTAFTFFNFLLIIFLPGIEQNSKELFGLIISRNNVKYLGLAIASINAGLTLIYLKKYKNKYIRYLICIISLMVIINSGKLSVILTLIMVKILKELSLKLPKKFSIKFLKIMITLFFFSSYIYLKIEVYLKKYINIERIFTGRVVLWKDYSRYMISDGNLFFGNGFFENGKNISYLTHPHNNYLSIVYTLGIVGGIVFLLFFFKIIEKTFKNLNKQNDYKLMSLLFIFFIMNTDDYFFITVYPIYNLIFIDALLKE